MNLIDKIQNAFCKKKLECKRYFDKENKTIDFPSMTANASILDVNAEISAKLGQIKTNSKVCVPDNISERLVLLDQNQYNIANAINSFARKKRVYNIEQYIKIIHEMHVLISKKRR